MVTYSLLHFLSCSNLTNLSFCVYHLQHIGKSIYIYLCGAKGLNNVMCGHETASHSVFKRLYNQKGHKHLLFVDCPLAKIKSSIMSKKGAFRQIVMDQFSDDQVWQSFRPIYLYVKLFGYWPSTYKVIYFCRHLICQKMTSKKNWKKNPKMLRTFSSVERMEEKPFNARKKY